LIFEYARKYSPYNVALFLIFAQKYKYCAGTNLTNKCSAQNAANGISRLQISNFGETLPDPCSNAPPMENLHPLTNQARSAPLDTSNFRPCSCHEKRNKKTFICIKTEIS
jgi:hypothetical protein